MSAQSRTRLPRPLLSFLGLTGLASLGQAQMTFSVDWHSPTVGLLDSLTATPITEGDILTPVGFFPAFGPLPVPGIAISGGAAGLGLFGHPGCVGHPGGTACVVEVDALSYGHDAPMGQNPTGIVPRYLFSTDEFAAGPHPPFFFPSLTSEFPVGDSSADVWTHPGLLPPGPLAPFAAPVGNVGVIDGDGLVSGSGALYMGSGLIEPNFPGFPNAGDNLDAFDWGSPIVAAFPPTGVYFSLDGPFPDPFGPPNTGSAPFHGFSPSDVLLTAAPGGPPAVWAPGPVLGLDITGFGPDDLDALAIRENGTGAFEPSMFPDDWNAPGGPDMVLFSVRRGSPVIGMPDSIFGIPIAEGDILTTPLPTIMGGVSPFPGIYCAGENLGLGTGRSGFAPEDLNALDTVRQPVNDCNMNGVEDAVDIVTGTSTDLNGNGVPDECEIVGGPYCYCPLGVAPCGNADPTAGCVNSTGLGGLLGASGTSSVAADDLVLTATQLPANKSGLFFAGPTMIAPLPFGDGLRCVGGGITRLPPVGTSSAAGVLSKGPGMAAAYGFLPFSTWNFQLWYRDPMGPCGSGFNTTNAYNVTFTP